MQRGHLTRGMITARTACRGLAQAARQATWSGRRHARWYRGCRRGGLRWTQRGATHHRTFWQLRVCGSTRQVPCSTGGWVAAGAVSITLWSVLVTTAVARAAPTGRRPALHTRLLAASSNPSIRARPCQLAALHAMHINPAANRAAEVVCSRPPKPREQKRCHDAQPLLTAKAAFSKSCSA